jgi:hypothetical protein
MARKVSPKLPEPVVDGLECYFTQIPRPLRYTRPLTPIEAMYAYYDAV